MRFQPGTSEIRRKSAVHSTAAFGDTTLHCTMLYELQKLIIAEWDSYMKWARKYMEERGPSHITAPFKQAYSGNFHHNSQPLRRGLNQRQSEHETVFKKKRRVAKNSLRRSIFITVIKVQFPWHQRIHLRTGYRLLKNISHWLWLWMEKQTNLIHRSALPIKKQYSDTSANEWRC